MTWQRPARIAKHPHLRAGLPPALPEPRAGRGRSPPGRACRDAGQADIASPARAQRDEGTGQGGSENQMQKAERPRQGSLRSARPRQPPAPARRSSGSHHRQPPAGLGAAEAIAADALRVPRPLRLLPMSRQARVPPRPSPLSHARCRGSTRQGKGKAGTGRPRPCGAAPILPGKPRWGRPGGAARHGRGESMRR